MADLQDDMKRGRIEKIYSTYGFVVDDICQEKHFFHFGTCVTKPEMLQSGDNVEFVVGRDLKSGRMHAQKVRLAKPGRQSVSFPLITQVVNPMLYNQMFPTLGSKMAPYLTNPVDVQGVVVVSPTDYEDTARGSIAFGLSDETFIADFGWASLKFPQERSLIKFACAVDMTVSYDNMSKCWVCRQLWPKVPEVQGMISYVNGQKSATIELAHLRRRVIYPLRFFTGKADCLRVGSCVQFILVSSPKGEIASRLRLLEIGAVTIFRLSPNIYCSPVLLLPDDETDEPGYVHVANTRGLKEPVPFLKDELSNNPKLRRGDFVEFQIKLDTRDNSKMAVNLRTTILSPVSPDLSPISPLSGRASSSSGVSSVVPQHKGFVAANTEDGGALIEMDDHSQLFKAKYRSDGPTLIRFSEVSFDLITEGESVIAGNIDFLPNGTISGNFIVSFEMMSGVVIKEANMEDAIYEGLIQCPVADVQNKVIHSRRFSFTLLSLANPTDYLKMVRGANVTFQIQAEPGDIQRAVNMRLDAN